MGLIFFKDWQTCKNTCKISNVKSDHVEKIKIFSLDKKNNSYTLFAEKLNAQYQSDAKNSTCYQLLRPNATLNTHHHQLKINSQYGSFFLPDQLELFENVTLYDTSPDLFYKLTTQNMFVHLGVNKIFGKNPVSGQCGYGVFSGKSFTINTKAQILTINGPCRIHFFGYSDAPAK
ncbi:MULTISPECIES: LPS export ABC transporter periplasmic protein LptC [Holospora]|nr:MULTISPECIES: LPS export ABC transporter periplasmic protein LptC [Holospora]